MLFVDEIRGSSPLRGGSSNTRESYGILVREAHVSILREPHAPPKISTKEKISRKPNMGTRSSLWLKKKLIQKKNPKRAK